MENYDRDSDIHVYQKKSNGNCPVDSCSSTGKLNDALICDQVVQLIEGRESCELRVVFSEGKSFICKEVPFGLDIIINRRKYVQKEEMRNPQEQWELQKGSQLA